MQAAVPTQTARAFLLPEPKGRLEDYLPMVRFQAKSIQKRLPPNIELEDLYAAGMIGLCEAYGKYEPNNGVRFGSYAQFRIRGAILDSLRSVDWAPRALRAKGRKIRETITNLTSRLGHIPVEEEIASAIQLTLRDYQYLLSELQSAELGTLNFVPDEESAEEIIASVPARSDDDPLSQCLQGEVTQRLTSAIEALPERERLVMTLYYFEELTRREISLSLGIREISVQQIRSSAIQHLRAAFSDFQGKREPIKLATRRKSRTRKQLEALEPAA